MNIEQIQGAILVPPTFQIMLHLLIFKLLFSIYRSTFCSFGGESPGIEAAGMDGDEVSRKVIVTGTVVISSGE